MAKIQTSTEKNSKIISLDPPRIGVSFTRTVLIDEEWNKAEANVQMSIKSIEDADEEFEKLWELVGNQVEQIVGGEHSDPEEDPENPEDPTEEDPEEVFEEDDPTEEDPENPEDPTEEDPEEVFEEDDPTEEDPEEETISEDDINEMSKPELIELCKSVEGLEEIDTSLKISSLRADIIATLFGDDPEEDPEEEGFGDDDPEEEGFGDDDPEDWENTDWEDD